MIATIADTAARPIAVDDEPVDAGVDWLAGLEVLVSLERAAR